MNTIHRNFLPTTTLTLLAVLLSLAASSARASSLLSNADFSSGLDGWTTTYTGANAPGPTCCFGPFAVTGPGEVTGDFDGEAGGGIDFHQSITLTGGYSTAELVFDYFSESMYFGLDRTLSVIIRDQTNTIDEATLFSVAVPESASYVTHSVSLTNLQSTLNGLSPGVHVFNFSAYIPETYSGPGRMKLSGISFVATVPEPSTALLLAVGLVGLAVRGRRGNA